MLKDKSRKNDYEFLIGTTLFLALSILYFISNKWLMLFMPEAM